VRPRPLVGPAVLLAGLGTLALAVTREEADLYLILIVPVVVGTGPLALLGVLLVFVGFFLTFLLWNAGTAPSFEPPVTVPGVPTTEEPASTPPARRWGGVVFLGPFPIVFGSDPQMSRLMLLLGAVLFIALLALTIALLLA
jgi:uncharacterized protein (TIGR00304 family)